MADIEQVGAYRIIRKIGAGGFGAVYLAKDSVSGDFVALKRVDNISEKSREASAIKLYEKTLNKAHSGNIIPIIRVLFEGDTLFYAMPLSDGDSFVSPDTQSWHAKTLESLIAERRAAKKWFSKDEVTDIMLPIVKAVEFLTDNGIIHRDIKPANILFLNGKPCLADIGLLTSDTTTISVAGTPDYKAPQWYLDTQGNPDAWGLAATLFTLITGKNPSYIGRVAHGWPPTGKESLDESDMAAWASLHRIINRTTRDRAKDRYLRIGDMYADLVCVAQNRPLNTPALDAEVGESFPARSKPTTSIFTPRGRISRKTLVLPFVLLFLAINWGGVMMGEAYAAAIVLSYLMQWPLLMLFIKRLHDANKSGWLGVGLFSFVFLLRFILSVSMQIGVPFDDTMPESRIFLFVGFDLLIWVVLFLVLLLPKGTLGPNRFGEKSQTLTIF